MYEKMLFGRKVLYFRYAPPLTKLDASDGDRPNPPFRGAPLYQCSVFYYWWAFLRENTAYLARCENCGIDAASDPQNQFGGSTPDASLDSMAAVCRDFGDVRGDDFMQWWASGGRLLFCEPPQEQIETFLSPPDEHDNDSRVLLSIPITADMDRTFAELRQLLRPVIETVRQNEHIAERARYPVHSKPVLTSLHQHLTVWQLKKAHPDWTNYQVAVEAGIDEDASDRQGSYDDRASASSIVGRFHRKAKALIENVAEGRFPDFSAKGTDSPTRSVTLAQARRHPR